jgi:TorA maturation chaperone TorD
MIDQKEAHDVREVDLARECVYRFLSMVAADPYSPGWERAREPQTHELAVTAMDVLRARVEQNPATLAIGELGAEALDLWPVVSELKRSVLDLQADYDRVFGLIIPKECPPYETEYHPPAQTFLRSQQLADVAGFYRAFGVEPSGFTHERPDHLALELEFVALLLTKKRLVLNGSDPKPSARDQADVCGLALQDFVRDHLAWWVPAFAAGLRRKADHGLYHALARVLAAFIASERQQLGIDPPFKAAEPALVEQPEEQTGCAGCALLV